MSIELALKAKEKLKGWIGKGGIVGVGVSNIKYVRGQPIRMDHYGVVVYVEKKLPPDQVDPNFLVPRTLNIEGVEVWTDVIESGRVAILIKEVWDRLGYKYSEPPRVEQACGCHTARCRPVQPGISICDCELTACTCTGPFIDPSTGKIYIVTNAHCTKYSRSCAGPDLYNRPMAQPGPYDSGVCPDDIVGYTRDKVSDLTQNGSTDTALIEPNPGIAVDNLLHGTDKRFNGQYRTPSPGDLVIKSGRTTGVQQGYVRSVHTDIQVDYGCWIRTIYDCIITDPILQPGDSGSPVVLPDGTFVGQGFAGSSEISALIDPNNIYSQFHVVPYAPAQATPTPTPTPTPAPPPMPDLTWLAILFTVIIIAIILILLFGPGFG